jgi:hypothetical protein
MTSTAAKVRADRDYETANRLVVVTVTCPIDACTQRSSGATHVAARAAIDDHFEHAHPGVAPMACDAKELRRK